MYTKFAVIMKFVGPGAAGELHDHGRVHDHGEVAGGVIVRVGG
jgi:hypothetical protein